MVSGVMPALPSSADSAIEKKPAWAAAINSSGFVPGWLSKRVLNEYGVRERRPLSVETVPLPSLSPPCHVADAVRFIVSFLSYGDRSPFWLIASESAKQEIYLHGFH